MRRLVLSLVLLWILLTETPMSAFARTFVYVSAAPEKSIRVFSLNEATGGLTAVDAAAVEGAPGSLAVEPKRRYLFASLRSTQSLASFRIDPKSGKLTAISQVALPEGENAAFVKTDNTGRWLLSASYSAGKVVVHGLKPDGTIESPAVQTVVTAKTAHCVAIDRANRLVFIPHVSPNAVFQFKFDADSGALVPATNETAPGGAEKAGPRHLAFHPKLPLAFTSDESGSSVTAYRYDSTTGLTPAQTLSTLPADFKEPNSTAEVKVHPNGKFVWVSNRGHDSLAGFAIDAKGTLRAIGQTPTEKTPRSFEIEPSGKWLFGAGEGSGKLAVFRVDAETGALDRTHTVEIGKSLTWVTAVRFE